MILPIPFSMTSTDTAPIDTRRSDGAESGGIFLKIAKGTTGILLGGALGLIADPFTAAAAAFAGAILGATDSLKDQTGSFTPSAE
jgi:hypothetical protein